MSILKESRQQGLLSGVYLWSSLCLCTLFYFVMNIVLKASRPSQESISLDNITPWLKEWVQQNDGAELQIMTLTFPVFITLNILLLKKLNRFFSSAKELLLTSLFGLTLLGILAYNLYLKESIPSFTAVAVITAICALLFYAMKKYTVAGPGKTQLAIWIFIPLAGALIWLTSEAPAFSDYSYLTGPAFKMSSGVPLKDFYMQYSPGFTLLFAIAHYWNPDIIIMQFVLMLLSCVWLWFCYKLAVSLFSNSYLVWLFMAAFVFLRYLAPLASPLSIPQAASLRLDLWIPLLWLARKYTMSSFVPAIAFAACYMYDDIFGFLYLCLYGALVCHSAYMKRKTRGWQKEMLLLVPALAALIIHYIMFGSIVSPSGKMYMGIHIAFLPIRELSAFWVLLLLAPFCTGMLFYNRRLGNTDLLMIGGILCIQLIYFFGRSHDNNLLNICGIMLLILFCAVDAMISTKRETGIFVSVAAIGLLALNYYQPAMSRMKNAWNEHQASLQRTKATEKTIADGGNYLSAAGITKFYAISDMDGYIHYRLSSPRPGFYTPLYAALFADETIRTLYDIAQSGYRLIIFPPSSKDDLIHTALSFNDYAYAKKNHFRFSVSPLGAGLAELTITKD